MLPSILVTGANGQLGQELQLLAKVYDKFEFTFATKKDLDITKASEVDKYVSFRNFQYCINCAAYTAVDKAEEEKLQAYLINQGGPSNLARVCEAYHIKLIHISSDYVFKGDRNTPYKENSPRVPINHYGNTKKYGEKQVLSIATTALIIRTSWVYSSFGNNFVKTMLRLMKERESINVVNDQIGSPTYAASLAQVLLHIIVQQENGRSISGVYHYSSEASISWYDFALAIKEISGSKCIINPIPTSAYPTPAKRSPYSVLDKTKIKTELGIVIPPWKEDLKKCIDLLIH